MSDREGEMEQSEAPQHQRVTGDLKMAKAMSHPVRVASLQILNERVASPSDIARELGLPVANVSYHVNTLARLGMIEEVSTRHVRGAIEHLYRATRRPLLYRREWETLSTEQRGHIEHEFVDLVGGELAQAAESGDLDLRTDRHLSHTPLRLDDEAWAQLVRRMDDLLEEALVLESQAAERMKAAGEGEVHARMTLCFYARGDAPPPAA